MGEIMRDLNNEFVISPGGKTLVMEQSVQKCILERPLGL